MNLNASPNTSEPLLTWHCEVPCDLNAVWHSWEKIRAFLMGQGLLEAELDAWELAFAEAVNNAIEHARPDARSKPVDVMVSCSNAEVQMSIHDYTLGFDWEAAGDLPEEHAEAGRGVFLMKMIADHSAYYRSPEGNLLQLRRKRLDNGKLDMGLATRLVEQEEIIQGMTDELSSAYEALVAIFRHSGDLGSRMDLHDFTLRLVDDLRRLTACDFAVLRLRDSSEAPFQTLLVLPEKAASASGAIPPPTDVPGVSLEADAVKLRKDLWFDAVRPLASADPLTRIAGMKSGLVHPFLLHGQVLGTLTLGRQHPQFRFGNRESSLIHTFCEFFVIHVGSLRSMEERVKTEVVQRDLETAAEIQRSLLPTAFPDAAPFQIVGWNEAARNVGGDFFDVIPLPDGRILFTIADVMGKGMPAAIFASVLRSTVRAVCSIIPTPGALMMRVNEILHDDFARVLMFATMQFVLLDPATRRICVATAGHCPLLLWKPGASAAELLEEGNVPLGVVRAMTYDDSEMVLPPGSRFLMYTDGLIEQPDMNNEMYGEQRLALWMASAGGPGACPRALQASLSAELAAFAGRQRIVDDQTFVIVSETSLS